MDGWMEERKKEVMFILYSCLKIILFVITHFDGLLQ